MQPVVRRILSGCGIRMDGLPRQRLTLLPRDQRRHRPLPGGHGARSLAAKLRALGDGYDLVIFMVDADSTDRREFTRKRDEILDGFHRESGIGGVACVPMSTSESWLMSDPSAWIALGLTDASLLPRQPERSWGRPRDPDGHHPHVDFARACGAIGRADGVEIRAELAEAVDLDEVRRKCPISYGAFDEDLKTASEATG